MYNILETTCTVVVVNAQHMKAVPGRKTDVKDAEWIADLLQHGLLRPSFIPDRSGRDLRELTRYRTSVVRERTAEINRIQKVLEGANIKLASVASNVVGVSGHAMLTAMIAGIDQPAVLADLARGRLREKRDLLEAALEGRMNQHQRFLLNVQLHHLHDLDVTIAQVSEEIELRLHPFAKAAARLMTIPGVGQRTAQTILAEVGADMSRFPSAAHLASWAGLCPGHHESAGKRTSGRTRKGSPWLRGALVEAATLPVDRRHTSANTTIASPRDAARNGRRLRPRIPCSSPSTTSLARTGSLKTLASTTSTSAAANAPPAASFDALNRSATPSASRVLHDLNLFSRQGAEETRRFQ